MKKIVNCIIAFPGLGKTVLLRNMREAIRVNKDLRHCAVIDFDDQHHKLASAMRAEGYESLAGGWDVVKLVNSFTDADLRHLTFAWQTSEHETVKSALYNNIEAYLLDVLSTGKTEIVIAYYHPIIAYVLAGIASRRENQVQLNVTMYVPDLVDDEWLYNVLKVRGKGLNDEPYDEYHALMGDLHTRYVRFWETLDVRKYHAADAFFPWHFVSIEKRQQQLIAHNSYYVKSYGITLNQVCLGKGHFISSVHYDLFPETLRKGMYQSCSKLKTTI